MGRSFWLKIEKFCVCRYHYDCVFGHKMSESVWKSPIQFFGRGSLQILLEIVSSLPPGGGRCDVGDLQAGMQKAGLVRAARGHPQVASTLISNKCSQDFSSEAVQAFGGMCDTDAEGVVNYSKFLAYCGVDAGPSTAPSPAAPVSMGLAAGPQGGNSSLPPVPPAAALRSVGLSGMGRSHVAGASSKDRRGPERQGIKVLEQKSTNQSVSDIVFGINYTAGDCAPARGVHKESDKVWQAFSMWEQGQMTADQMIRKLEQNGIKVSAKARNVVYADSQLNFQQFLFMLNEYTLDERTTMGLPSKGGHDIKGHKRVSHEGQV